VCVRVCVCVCACVGVGLYECTISRDTAAKRVTVNYPYGVALVSWIDQIIGLFCKRAI